MSGSCEEFRKRLADWLRTSSEGVDDERGLEALRWDAHRLSCPDCQRLLEDEQALNELLDSVPDPRLTPTQRSELFARLRDEARLESLLSLADPMTAPPTGLAARVWAHVQSEQELTGLDRQLAHMDSIEAPPGLAQRVWNHCQEAGEALPPTVVTAPAAARQPKRSGAKPARRQPVLRGWLKTGLAAAGLAALLWYMPGLGDSDPIVPGPGPGNETVAHGESQPESDEGLEPAPVEEAGQLDATDEELLAMLDTLEILDMVDELDGEEWELLDEYDQLALLVLEDELLFGDDSDPSDGGEAR